MGKEGHEAKRSGLWVVCNWMVSVLSRVVGAVLRLRMIPVLNFDHFYLHSLELGEVQLQNLFSPS
jgi:hypothetical protein